jgi:purine-cytosine permease-like protein
VSPLLGFSHLHLELECDKWSVLTSFILVMLAFSVVGTCAQEINTISVDFQVLIPKADKIPCFIWVLVTAGAIIGAGIGAVEHFYTALTSFLEFIGFWCVS